MALLNDLTLKIVTGEATSAEMEELERLVEDDVALRQAHLKLLEEETSRRGIGLDLEHRGATLRHIWESIGQESGPPKPVDFGATDLPSAAVPKRRPQDGDLDDLVSGAFNSVFGDHPGARPIAPPPQGDSDADAEPLVPPPPETGRQAVEAMGQSLAPPTRTRALRGAVWFVKQGEKVVGPITETELSALLSQGEANAETMVCRSGHEEWLALWYVTELRTLIPPTVHGVPRVRTGDPQLGTTFAPAATPAAPSPMVHDEDDPFSPPPTPAGTPAYLADTSGFKPSPADLLDLNALSSSAIESGEHPWKDQRPDEIDPFAQPILSSELGVNVEQIAGQSSMLRWRPSFGSGRRPRWFVPVLLGFGGGGLAAAIVSVVLYFFLWRPQAPVAPVEPGPPSGAGASEAPALGEPAPGEPAPPVGAPTSETPTAAAPVEEAATEPTPASSGRCDPLLYPGGRCPKKPANDVQAGKRKLGRGDILATVERNRKRVNACVAEQRRRNPRLARGTVKVQWYIQPSGKTRRVSLLTPKFQGTYLGKCLIREVRRWRFPAFDGPEAGPVKYPFSLDRRR